jgi:hypothetical protein
MSVTKQNGERRTARRRFARARASGAGICVCPPSKADAGQGPPPPAEVQPLRRRITRPRLRFWKPLSKRRCGLYPPAFGFAREVAEPFTAAGHYFARGAVIMFSVYATMGLKSRVHPASLCSPDVQVRAGLLAFSVPRCRHHPPNSLILLRAAGRPSLSLCLARARAPCARCACAASAKSRISFSLYAANRSLSSLFLSTTVCGRPSTAQRPSQLRGLQYA